MKAVLIDRKGIYPEYEGDKISSFDEIF
jgi:hypothetical protein